MKTQKMASPLLLGTAPSPSLKNYKISTKNTPKRKPTIVPESPKDANLNEKHNERRLRHAQKRNKKQNKTKRKGQRTTFVGKRTT